MAKKNTLKSTKKQTMHNLQSKPNKNTHVVDLSKKQSIGKEVVEHTYIHPTTYYSKTKLKMSLAHMHIHTHTHTHTTSFAITFISS
jgi:ribosomal protein S25